MYDKNPPENGGFVSNLDSNRIFELGYTTTNGTGVGLAYAKRTIKKWGGDIFLPDTQKDGFSIIVRLKDEH